MGHDYGVPLRFLSMTPTRDNDSAPGNRMADKHSRLLCGKTLDEWTMLQLWSSKYLGKSVFICETEKHAEKLDPLAAKYGVELMVRPRDMLHPLNDSGGIPLHWATKRVLDSEWYTLMTHAFVVSPCRPPGFFDDMVDFFASKFGNPDQTPGQAWVIGGVKMTGAMYELDAVGRGHQLGGVTGYLTDNPDWRLSNLQHLMANTHWWIHYYSGVAGRSDVSIKPYFYDIPAWQDVHIDTEEQWDLAEHYMKTKILSQGDDCYERYRNLWLRNDADPVSDNVSSVQGGGRDATNGR